MAVNFSSSDIPETPGFSLDMGPQSMDPVRRQRALIQQQAALPNGGGMSWRGQVYSNANEMVPMHWAKGNPNSVRGAYSSAAIDAVGGKFEYGGFSGPIPNTGRGTYDRGARIAANKSAAAAKTAERGSRSALSKLYGGVNTMTKATMGVSAGKLALGGGLAVGALGALDYAIGRDPFSDAGSAVGGVQRFFGAMKEASRPSYGTSAFQQSTQGLVFGLHNARTAY